MDVRSRRLDVVPRAEAILAIVAIAAALALLWVSVGARGNETPPRPAFVPPPTSAVGDPLAYLFSEDFPAFVDLGG